MSMYVAVRGWLEVHHEQRPQVLHIIESYRDQHYSGGWGLPAAPFNWTLYVFYGGDLRESGVDWLHTQVSEIARLSSADEDRDMPVGFFLLNDERQQSTTWTVRDGRLDGGPAPKELEWFARQP